MANHGQDEQSHLFNKFWREYSPQIARGGSGVDITERSHPIVTLVSRIKRPLSTTLDTISTDIADNLENAYRYPIGEIHTTILYLSPYLVESGFSRSILSDVSTVLANAISGDPLKYTIRGIGVFPTTIFAQMYHDNPATIVDLRRRISDSMIGAGYSSGDATEYFQNLDLPLSFANIVRFIGPVNSGIVSRVSKYRDAIVGEANISDIELVVTDKLLSDANTTILERYYLS